MSMELTKWVEGSTERGYGEKGIVLKGGDERVLSATVSGGIVRFMEECDGEFSAHYTKEEALQVLDELRDWINSR